ncbi:MAG: serine hydrolase domain-containing protein [Bacteroidales bacterium]|nr:serine hydrolase domain-containing protein [Bacteroidales bacterium]
MNKERFSFNGSVLIGYHGMPAYYKTFGYADFSEKEPISENIPFQLASVSKQFTAISVIMLVEEGVLNYGDTVAHFIPDFPYPRVTVEQLLHHTAGMPNYMWLLEHKWERGKEAYNDDIIYLMKTHETNLYFRPGTRYDLLQHRLCSAGLISWKLFPEYLSLTLCSSASLIPWK